jgi:Cu-Zn family superoxide dismutase
VHVHRIGDCSAPDASSAGPHFNPEGHEHALPPRDARHLGDLGNMLVRADGTGRLEIVVEGATLERDDPHSLLNRAIIFHAEQDTGEGESGEAGGRLACGEIGVDPNAPVASR